MAEVLSQTEIDALLAAVSSGSIETEETSANAATGVKAPTDWIAYDLTSQEKIVRGRLAALQGIHERFSRVFRSTLSQALKKNVSVTCSNTDFIRFGDYLGNILLPTSLNILHMTNLKGYMVFVVGSKLTYALIDSYYGGSERPFSKIGGREEFTSIENTMIQKFCQMAMGDLQEAWRLNYPVELEYVKSENNPHFVGHIHSSETVAVVTFEVEFENLSGPLILILQVRALDPIVQFLAVNVTGEISAQKDVWSRHWKKELSTLPLDLKVELGATHKRLQDMNDLQVGQTIILEQDAALPLAVVVEGIPKLKGFMGVCRGNAAVRVTDINPSIDDSNPNKE